MNEPRRIDIVICTPLDGGDHDFTLQELLGSLRVIIRRGSIDQLKTFTRHLYGDGHWEETRDICDILIYRRKLQNG